MNSGALLVNAAVPLVVLAAAWLTPSMTSPTLPFGVRIPAARADAPVIAEQRKRYRWLVSTAGGALVALNAGLSATAHLLWSGLVPVLLFAVCAAAYYRSRVAIAAAKRDEDWYRGLRQGVVTDTSLRTDPETFPWLWSIPALLIVAGTAVVAIVLYPSVPDRFPVHFNASGTPDRFATKSVGSVFFPVFLQAGVTATILVLAWFALCARPELDPARPADSARRHRRFSVRAAISLLLLAACVDLSILAGAWPIWHADHKLSPVLVMLPLLVGLAIVVGVAIRTGQGGSRLPAADSGVPEENAGVVRRDDDRYWRAAGSLYVNRDDPSLLVQKRSGFGWTLNFGNPRALLLFALITGLPLALPLIVR
ncbi:DUF1648 domain-containing protein [Streptantibioticus ferralitis]|uniref:DUF1648 domain-containing protein n=1 Tax=Streptantibioticus ferralitis TaxID=236510 RepID=A0ABT5Z5A3_9ACTN|nr:DUF1648 domain-containing protein [Streptantibioticus ferralitis]MDF2259016.1 DUF1648 domain-containing protein [Streptantibioticus ferralitis]